jgi:hypothetical protein
MAPNSNVLPSSRHFQRKRKYQSDECDFSDDDSGFSPKSSSPSADDDRRAHHNELERRRRDHIKDHFSSLKNAIPLLEGEKSSRALILKRAVDYIQVLQAQLKEAKMEIEDQKRRNSNNEQHQFLQHQLQQQQQTVNVATVASNTVPTFGGLINHSAITVPQPPPPSQPQQHLQQQVFSLPSVSTAFGCMSLPPSTSVIHHPTASYPSTVSECCLQPSSPMAATTVPTTFTSNLSTEQAAKTALLSQLLLQNLGQLIQVPTTSSLLSTTDFSNNNNQQQLFNFNNEHHRQQLSAAAAIHL